MGYEIMYHGTTLDSYWGIKRNGFRVSGRDRMLGPGVYASRQFEKAKVLHKIQYSFILKFEAYPKEEEVKYKGFTLDSDSDTDSDSDSDTDSDSDSSDSDCQKVVLELYVNTGRQYICRRQDDPLRTRWQRRGYDSCWVPPGSYEYNFQSNFSLEIIGILFSLNPSGLEEHCIRDPDSIQIIKVHFMRY